MFFITVSLILGFTPYIDFSAHLGGVVTGCLLGIGIFIHKKDNLNSNLRKGISISLFTTILILFIIGLVSLYTYVTTPKL